MRYIIKCDSEIGQYLERLSLDIEATPDNYVSFVWSEDIDFAMRFRNKDDALDLARDISYLTNFNPVIEEV